jgi:hypothetical protein
MKLIVAWDKWKLTSVCLEMVLISVSGRCMVCAEYTMGVEIFLATANGLSR